MNKLHDIVHTSVPKNITPPIPLQIMPHLMIISSTLLMTYELLKEMMNFSLRH